jgi:hypothetical protein
MASSAGTKMIQCVSYAINHYSTLPFISRMHLYDVMQNYIIENETRLQILENKISQLHTKLEIYENQNKNKKFITINH